MMATRNYIVDGKPIEFIEGEEKEVFKPEPMYDYNEEGIGTSKLVQPTELGEVIDNLNRDQIKSNRMTEIDLRSRLHPLEISSILAVDSLVAFKFLPVSCLAFTRQKKRLAVSLNGLGRSEIVQIVAGKRELESKSMNFFERVKGLWGGGKIDNTE